MSFSRWGADGSNVYTFPDVSGDYECCACHMTPDAIGFRTPDPDLFIEHLDAHEAEGDVVPAYTRPAIREWAAAFPNGWEAAAGRCPGDHSTCCSVCGRHLTPHTGCVYHDAKRKDTT